MIMSHPSPSATPKADPEAWKAIVLQIPEAFNVAGVVADRGHARADCALWYLMYLSLPVSWWLVVPLAMLMGALLVRVFIIFHDCGHGSFFKSRAANDTVGFLAGILTFTPYYHWRWEHAIHHSAAGDLDRRGTGDVWTLTVQEYLESSRWKKFAYRLARNPFVLFVLAPLYLFLIQQRLPSPKASARERHSVYAMNAALLGMAIGLSHVFGVLPYLLIQLIALMVAGGAGVWLFYVQHQFEGVYWDRGEDWSFVAAALQGQFVLQTAARAAMVLRQHRLPPHSSFESAHSQLQPRKMPPGRPAVPSGETHHVFLQLQVLDLPAVG